MTTTTTTYWWISDDGQGAVDIGEDPREGILELAAACGEPEGLEGVVDGRVGLDDAEPLEHEQAADLLASALVDALAAGDDDDRVARAVGRLLAQGAAHTALRRLWAAVADRAAARGIDAEAVADLIGGEVLDDGRLLAPWEAALHRAARCYSGDDLDDLCRENRDALTDALAAAIVDGPSDDGRVVARLLAAAASRYDALQSLWRAAARAAIQASASLDAVADLIGGDVDGRRVLAPWVQLSDGDGGGWSAYPLSECPTADDLMDWIQSWAPDSVPHSTRYEARRVRPGVDDEGYDDDEEDEAELLVHPKEPKCPCGEHDWQSPHEIVGGCRENPGVWGTGGIGLRYEEVCLLCGCRRTTETAQQPYYQPSDHERVAYDEGDDATVDAVARWWLRRGELPRPADGSSPVERAICDALEGVGWAVIVHPEVGWAVEVEVDYDQAMDEAADNEKLDELLDEAIDALRRYGLRIDLNVFEETQAGFTACPVID